MRLTLSRRGMYLLPNLFTTSSLFCGFSAIYAASLGDIALSAIAIFVAMVMDTLDGRVARITNTQSRFGAGYDSLVDIVSFGIAPALLAYSWGLQNFNNIGWIASFFYVTATALRLARFNTRTVVEHDRYFQGLPCTLAAGFVTTLVWSAHQYDISGLKIWACVAIIISIISALMISSIRYNSFKNISVKRNRLQSAMLMIFVLCSCLLIEPILILLGALSVYVLSGPLLVFFKAVNKS